jgi:hypothetical protein
MSSWHSCFLSPGCGRPTLRICHLRLESSVFLHVPCPRKKPLGGAVVDLHAKAEDPDVNLPTSSKTQPEFASRKQKVKAGKNAPLEPGTYAVTIVHRNDCARSGNSTQTQHYHVDRCRQAAAKEAIGDFSCYRGCGADETNGTTYAECTGCRMSVTANIEKFEHTARADSSSEIRSVWSLTVTHTNESQSITTHMKKQKLRPKALYNKTSHAIAILDLMRLMAKHLLNAQPAG